ncbi:DUF3000 domain-containing protein [Microbacterium sp. GXS0129]|uniref:DUF3000 domain-containing protein n=1 Tax=Microbacterium sp. GXS0129 TaxID=3377836 RepID=UPI00383B9161
MTGDSPVDAIFAQAQELLRAVTFREDFSVREIPAPQGLAPYAIALAGDVRPAEEGESAYGTGRFVLLFDPSSPDVWEGPWRIVCFAQAPMEPEIGADPLLASVAWSWLRDALTSHEAQAHAVSGTATKTISTGFGSLAAEGDGAQIELRASWSPSGAVDGHVRAWAELVCMLAGLPPGSEQIEIFGARHMRSTAE